MSRKKQKIVPPILDGELVEYAIYCRKSTDESDSKQIASIPKQIDLCIKHAISNDLIIKKKPKDFPFEEDEDIRKEDQCVDLDDRGLYRKYRNFYIIKEQHSAKEPHKRKKWTKLMQMVRDGKIRGIISYSPDRQARNMVEGGELIDFADQGIVKLKYTNFHFEPTASGKMMLGIWFVFSKQYSDKLSEDVTSANKRKFEKGETLGDIKHGYTRDDKNRWIPDGDNYELIKKAFLIKIEEGWSDERIAEWLNLNGFYRLIKKTGKKRSISANMVNVIWTDPFYYGFWIRADQMIDLRGIKNYDFQNAITYTQHEWLCERYKSFEERSRSPINKKDDIKSLRMVENDFVVFEDKGGNRFNLTLNLPNKGTRHKKKLIELRESNPKALFADFIKPHQIKLKCSQNNLSITLEDVDKVIRKKLKQLHVTQEQYDAYLQYTHDKLDMDFQEINYERQKHQLRINQNRSQRQGYMKKNLENLNSMGADEKKIYEGEKQEYLNKIEFHENQIKKLDTEEEAIVFNTEILLKFMKNAVQYYDKSDYVRKEKIIKILFSNIVVNEKKRLSLAVKPDLASLFVLNGRGERT